MFLVGTLVHKAVNGHSIDKQHIMDVARKLLPLLTQFRRKSGYSQSPLGSDPAHKCSPLRRSRFRAYRLITARRVM